MITLQNAILAINPNIVTIRGDVAYDVNEQEVPYNKAAAEAKLAELEAAEIAVEQNKNEAHASAVAKLTALGLTSDEITALIG